MTFISFSFHLYMRDTFDPAGKQRHPRGHFVSQKKVPTQIGPFLILPDFDLDTWTRFRTQQFLVLSFQLPTSNSQLLYTVKPSQRYDSYEMLKQWIIKSTVSYQAVARRQVLCDQP